MKFFAVVMVVAMSFYVQISADTDAADATQAPAGDSTDVVINSCHTCTNATDLPCAIASDITKKPCPEGAKNYCYTQKIFIIAENNNPGVLRGCSSKDIACPVVDTSLYSMDGNCTNCITDNCNNVTDTRTSGQSLATGSTVQCALISSLMVARMFSLTK